MHFYTYDDWVAHAYSTKNDKEIFKGQTKIIDVTDRIGWGSDKVSHLNITSRFNPTISVKSTAINPTFNFYSSDVDCDLGCLYKFRGTWDGPYESRYKNSGCIQILDDSYGSPWPDAMEYPYIHLTTCKDSGWSHLTDEILTIEIEPGYFDILDKVLIFQSIYSGCIEFSACQTSLEFQLGKTLGTSGQDFNRYDYIMNTNLYSATSQMIVGALITFDTSGEGQDKRYNLIIENISEFVYGHVDMAQKFGWKNLWKCFQPSKNSKAMPSSIMHYSKD